MPTKEREVNISENQIIHIQATEIIGCWLDKERRIKNGRVCVETT